MCQSLHPSIVSRVMCYTGRYANQGFSFFQMLMYVIILVIGVLLTITSENRKYVI